MWRITEFVVCVVLALFTPVWLFGLLALDYSLRFGGIELIIVAGLVDAYLAPETSWPVYTLLTLSLIVVAAVLRPYLSVYNQDDEAV